MVAVDFQDYEDGTSEIASGHPNDRAEGIAGFPPGGDDLIHGSGMGDVLYGDFDPNDPREWVPPAGNGRIYGNGGDDVIFGGGGENELYGGDGDDYLEGGDGFDMLAGGAGDNTAMFDTFDKMIEIERMMVVN